ncbi:MAG: phosphoglycerate kinase [Cardiobacteriaceae bacterium]|nr:phosphoglycerate kinase [Cardiobacteriaceae bacterium]
MRTLANTDIQGKRVLMRLDLNVPVKDGKVTSDARITAALPTIKLAREKGASSILIMAHFGRPNEGEFDEAFSLAPVAAHLSQLLGEEIPLIKDYLDNPPQVADGKIVLLENVRFNKGEKKNCPELSAKYAKLGDVFVSDGFGVVHRAQASTVGVAEKIAVSCAGLLVQQEVETLDKILQNPTRPMLAIVGGSKVSTKLSILQSLLDKVDILIPGGGIANTFLVAKGYSVGGSLYEPDLVEEARQMLEKAKARGISIPLPVDVVVGDEFSAEAKMQVKSVEDVADNELIMDIGPQTAAQYARTASEMKTIVWNGPVGVFEFPAFAEGTKTLCDAVAKSTAFSFVGGGDTIAAVQQFGVSDKIDYISTGGGSMLEYLEGKKLPGVEILR